ncbi:hypothetical protein COS81_04655 [candidate division WWE3 bacterium CG06_land_8_20_14_3_00_42_16]|uniref:histidine kinase n=4 Tax=Katanobacteria TaxID=422282 RepID=A0A2M7ALH8_UNCKA|nr:MAG: hypothetical protein AUJ38_01280 [bacterium CG1_02_42_9]PIU68252.1 MAG: hypothetical protein COS81_04655 [candidate division WWE3 bacterium CG06_land_8_20_14_3_00_42_16]PIZ43920.1 MAG: hypothetical protein COY34_00055 [candidate division WWE3 bacterium CG_4_10_14_0_2_um_filter_42_8]PJA38442.1 MAG: hypothetical protein CO181_00410 [candidate division WWE3 bacterium CG_4_9_14_3_um_filter_43_9]PJC68950.1 MAG: hypothetical protein CO015_02165 [candidate division WWE3 bacterium CG_4_8_14_3_u
MRKSIVTKILGIVILVPLFLFSIFTFLYIREAKAVFDNLHLNKAISLIQTLDANITNVKDLDDRDKLQLQIYKLMWLNPDLIQVSINLPGEKGLEVAASNNVNLVDKPAEKENQQSLDTDKIISQQTKAENARALLVVTPLHVAGQSIGTYEMVLSLSAVDQIVFQWEKNLLIINSLSLIILAFVSYFLLRKIIVDPIRMLSKGMEVVSGGNLNYAVKIKSQDEIGRLGSQFNDMARKLKTSQEQTEEYSQKLEKQVTSKTIELNKTADELEKRRQEMKVLSKMLKDSEIKMAQLGQKTREELEVAGGKKADR